MNRHAFLIMAHNHFDFLKILLKRLDDPRNDIYLHVDRKAADFSAGSLIPFFRIRSCILQNGWTSTGAATARQPAN